MNSKAKILIKNTAIYGAIIGVSAFLFFGVLKIATVSGNSMNDTYFDGEKLLCLRHAEPEKGDVIITDCDAGIVLIKRVIATEGDTVDIDFDSGAVKVNGETLVEPYIKEMTHLDEGAFEYPITVPDNCYFVMGDNRNNSLDSRRLGYFDNRNYSSDSRDKAVGYIKKDQIQAKVICEIPFF